LKFCALDVNRNFDLHVFSRAGPVAAATNLAEKAYILSSRDMFLLDD